MVATMTEPLTRVANAIGDTLNKGTARDVLENAALVAICSIRKPSEAMIAAGATRVPGSEGRTVAARVWDVMIEAMLRE
jgi:hypothetical protein